MRIMTSCVVIVLTAGCSMLTAQSTELSAADKAFMKTAAEANMTEAHLGKMAEDQASDSDIKAFGQTLVQDHTKAYEQLTAVANKTGDSIPKGIDAHHNAVINQLTRQKGASFDRTFLRHEVQDHQKTIAEFKQEIERGQNPDVKAYAEKTLPKLQEHLQKAEELQKSEKASAAVHGQHR